MANRDVDSSRHSYTGGHFRQRLKNLVVTYVDAKVTAVKGTEPSVVTRSVEDRRTDEENNNKVDAKDVPNVPGEEKLLLFPTYARVKPHLFHAMHQHASTSEHVDIELHVHGQVSIPHPPNTPYRRKDRILLGVARQICGLPHLPSSHGIVKNKNTDIIQSFPGSSPTYSPEHFPTDNLVDELDLIDLNIAAPTDAQSIKSCASSLNEEPRLNHSASFPANAEKYSAPTRSTTLPSPPTSSPISTPKSWKNSNNFPLLDLATCHANLMERLAPFIARSVTGQLVTIKVYAPPLDTTHEPLQIIAQRQFLTNEHGHFTGRLLVTPPQNATPPKTWTITASLSTRDTNISVQGEVRFIPERGVSLISDIDDTVKHTSILSGAREIFRNTFVRDLSSMSVDGVREWYSELTDMGVQIHYVSNSPFQCWPIIQSFMNAAGLPRGGSVHLKQYSGMISGIWENAAEKKRAGVEAVVRDFPSRKFILVGDSGEQDLELYTEMALTYRGQVLGIFIRDVTTPLLLRASPSSSSMSLPCFFEGNGPPTQKHGRLSHLKGLRETWRGKTQEHVPTLSTLNTTENLESTLKEQDLDEFSLNEMDVLSPLVLTTDLAGEDVLKDIPPRMTQTPPPLSPHPQRSPSSSSIHSMDSEPPSDSPSPPKTFTQEARAEEQSSRMKKVENWKRRLARARERLTQANSKVEVWTWRVGSDVEKICQDLVIKEYNNGVGDKHL